MSIRPKVNLMKAGLAVAGVLCALAFSPTPANAADPGKPLPIPAAATDDIGIQASYFCHDWFVHPGGHAWSGYCKVYSGQIRTVTYCTDWHYNSVGAWIGPRDQDWYVYGDCGLSQVSSVQIQTMG